MQPQDPCEYCWYNYKAKEKEPCKDCKDKQKPADVRGPADVCPSCCPACGSHIECTCFSFLS